MVERTRRRIAWPWVAALSVVALLAAGDRLLPAARLGVYAAVDTVRREVAAGRYSSAESRAEALYRALQFTGDGAGTLALQTLDLWVEASWRNGKAASAIVVTRAEQAVTQWERLAGRDHPETAPALHNLAELRAAHGDLSGSLALHERALASRLAAVPPDDRASADSLDWVGLALIRLDRFTDAKKRLEVSLRTRETRAGRDPLALARTLELTALMHRIQGDYQQAEQPLARAVAIRDEFSAGHPENVSLLQLRGDLLFLRGDGRNARVQWSDALSLSERTLGRTHPSTPELLRRLGLAAFSEGDLVEARQLRERALQMAEVVLAPCDPVLVRQIDAVASSLESSGDFAGARRELQRSLASTEKCFGAAAPRGPSDTRATTLFNLGEMAREMGDLDAAETYYRRAVDDWSAGLGRDHSFVARGLGAIAEVAASRGQLDRARDLYGQALAIRRKALGADHPLVGWTLVNMARVLGDSGRLDEALQHADRALVIYMTAGTTDDPDHLARAFEVRGRLLAQRRQFAAGRESLAQALNERARIFGPRHPLVAEVRRELAGVDFSMGAARAALDGALEAEDVGRESLRKTIRYLPERQAVRYAARRPRGLDLALSVAVASSGLDTRPLFNAVIRSRGVILDEIAARGRTLDDGDPDVRALARTEATVQQRYANLVVRSLGEQVPLAALDDARTAAEEAQRALLEHSAKAREALARQTAGVEEVTRALPADSVLVAFVRYERADAARPARPTASYAAFVAGANRRDPEFVTLGDAAIIDGAVSAWRTAVTASVGQPALDRSVRQAGETVRRLVWDPVARRLGSSRAAFVVPDGSINLINLDALPDGREAYLAEREIVFRYLSTERDLVQPEAAGGAGHGSLLAIGGPTFDLRTGAPAETGTLRSGCDALGRTRFSDLPGARNEVVEVGRYWSAGGGGVTTLSGDEATEAAVKRALPGHAIVHLATHAYFLGDGCEESQAEGTRAVGGLARTGSAAVAALVQESPLLLSGLALTGANQRTAAGPDADDGMLTAGEVAALNLQGTDWAVLSACDTGLGTIQAGEGVFGLRRAFQIAGVRTVITSLWPVSDQATRAWMRGLYEARLARGLGSAAAVRAASLAVLHQRRADGQSTNPVFWAAFVAAGDWR